VLMSCRVVMGGFSLLVFNIDLNLNELGLMNEIRVFVEKDLSEEEIVAIEAQIRALDNVLSVERTTPEEGLEELREGMDEDTTIFDDIDAGATLTDEFSVKYEDNSKVVSLNYALNQIPGVRKVNDKIDLAMKIESLKNGILMVFIWFLAILMIVSIFVIINTIKLSVFSRRNEISIMRYVGATGWFITLPFLFEGIIIGLVASAASFFIEWYGYLYIESKLISGLQMISIIQFDEIKWIVLIGFVAVGVITSVIGSCISLGKYLKS